MQVDGFFPAYEGSWLVFPNNTLCLNFSSAKGNEGPTKIDNYEKELLSKRYYRFEYNFGTLDYNRAEPCDN